MTAPVSESSMMETTGQLWLFRLILNPRSSDARHDLANCVAMHGRLCSLFDQHMGDTTDWYQAGVGLDDRGPLTRNKLALLWRGELPSPTQPWASVLAQANARPNFAALPKHYAIGMEDKPIGSMSFAVGTGLRFRMRANDTYTYTSRSTGKQVTIGQLDWLTRMSGHHGFVVVAAQATVDPLVVVRRQRDDAPMTFVSCLFDGVLRVTNPTKFNCAVTNGIGHGKAYGFGLLSLARA